MKKFKTYDEQIDYLMENKNIKYSEEIKEVLKERQYTSIINPYKTLFSKGKDKENNHIYDDEIDFDCYIRLAKADDFYANKISILIGSFERRLKVSLGYHISHQMFLNNDSYAVEYKKTFKFPYKNINKDGLLSPNKSYSKYGKIIKDRNRKKNKVNLLKKIRNIAKGKEKSKNEIVLHYQSKKKGIPFWIIMHALSFGELAILYDMCGSEIRSKVYEDLMYRERKSIKELNKFSGYLETIRLLRNKVNHYESLTPYIINKSKSTNVTTVLKILVENYNKSIVKIDETLDFINVYDDTKSKKIKILKEFYEKCR